MKDKNTNPIKVIKVIYSNPKPQLKNTFLKVDGKEIY